MSYNPNQPREPAGRPTGGQWVGYNVARKHFDAMDEKDRAEYVRGGGKVSDKIKEQRGADAFLDELWEGTQPHPFDPRIRLYGNIGIEASRMGDMIHLSSIISFGEKGKGEASRALRELADMADRHGVVIEGTAKAFPAGAKGRSLTTKQLFDWYGRHGFRRQPYVMGPGLSDRIMRTPRPFKK
jgi:hypothetical protein